MKNILIAGGTGLIGTRLTQILREKGHTVSILSRNPKGSDHYLWNPSEGKMNEDVLKDVQVLINLSGAGIADKKWTADRKKELHHSRVGTNVFLYSFVDKMPRLEQFICSSGINCYGYNDSSKVYVETDSFGNDYLSQLVKVWELSADLFSTSCKVAKVRTAVVLDESGGALKKMIPAIKFGVGSAIGTGKQDIAWIHYRDLSALFAHIVENSLDGAYNALAGSTSNEEFMRSIAKTLKRPFFFPKVPAFLMKMIFGEMAIILLYGNKASNEKIRSTGFEFKYTDLSKALKDVL